MTAKDRYRVSAETGIHPRTIKKWEDGERVSPQSEYAIRAALEKLSIDPPERAAS